MSAPLRRRIDPSPVRGRVEGSDTVLYILGAGRSGSTLLEILLGNLEGYFSVGEIRFFWQYLGIPDLLCGCGELLEGCPVWTEVRSGLSRSMSEVEQRRVARLARRLDRSRQLPWISAGLLPRVSGYRRLAGATARLYREIRRVSGCRVLVDSSKVPSHLDLLLRSPGLDVRALHLVRDGRAVAYSWSRRQKRELARGADEARIPRHSLVRALITWMVENAFARRIGKGASEYTLMRYEDFVAEPAATLERALEQLGLGGPDLRRSDGRTFEVAPTHSVGGNPMRFTTRRSIEIRDREEWRRQLPGSVRLFLGVLAAPSLLRYGYRL